MKAPISITFFIVLLTAIFNYWLFSLCLPIEQILPHIISSTAIAGGLISATFAIFGYYLKLNAFKETLKPSINIWVTNGQGEVRETGLTEHFTIIHYKNLGNDVANNIEITAVLLNKNICLSIPGLFPKKMDISPNDSRDRNFPTKTYLSEKKFSKDVIGVCHAICPIH